MGLVGDTLDSEFEVSGHSDWLKCYSAGTVSHCSAVACL